MDVDLKMNFNFFRKDTNFSPKDFSRKCYFNKYLPFISVMLMEGSQAYQS